MSCLGSAAHSHIKKLQVLLSKCFHIPSNAPWYIGNKQIHDNSRVPYFSDHIRHLIELFDSMLADVGKPLVARLGSHICWPIVGRLLTWPPDRRIGALSVHPTEALP
jgi:hypothetical protein